MLLAENQVIERNIEHLPAGNVLLFDLLDDSALTEFAKQRPDINWFGYTPFFDTKQKYSQTSVVHNAWPVLDDFDNTKFDAVVIYFPKTKLRFDYYLSIISKLLNENATIYVVGEKKGGVKSCDKALKAYSPKANKLDAARHCMLFTAAFNGHQCKKQLSDWFDEKTVSINVAEQHITLTLCSLPGVFSASGVDVGTELLLNTVTEIDGFGLDFGCGCGVISAAIASAFNTEMLAIDVDALAVASANQTFDKNEINAKAITSNGLSEIINKHKFDFIITNPPFHTGIATDYGITEQLLKQSANILKKRYQYWMVANSFLPYPDLFKKYLTPANIKNKDKRFTIYHIAK